MRLERQVISTMPNTPEYKRFVDDYVWRLERCGSRFVVNEEDDKIVLKEWYNLSFENDECGTVTE